MRLSTGGRYPRYAVWENVPGAFSSNKGMDFRAVLESLTKTSIPIPRSGRWAAAGVVRSTECDIEWRVLDAQYWGVPQRRKRIFLVADFGTFGRRAGKILFEPKGMSGNIETGGTTRKETAGSTESGACGASGSLTPWDVQSKQIYREDGIAPCLSGADGSGRQPIVAAGFKAGQSRAGGLGYEVEKAATLAATHSGLEPTVAVYDMTHADEVMRPVEGGKCQTLNARMGTGGNQVPVVSYAIAGNIIGRENQNGGHHMGVDKDVSFTLNTVDRHAVAAVDCRNGRETPKSGTLQSKSSGGYSLNYQNPVRVQRTVRRLTPTECERLQGLPDGYTLIDVKTCSDTARYKALGNGMAQPCADWVIKRIVETIRSEEKTQGSA